MAIASAMPGRPNGPTSDDRQRAVDDHRADRGEDRRDRVLPGVERPGQHGDQRVGGQADEERDAA